MPRTRPRATSAGTCSAFGHTCFHARPVRHGAGVAFRPPSALPARAENVSPIRASASASPVSLRAPSRCRSAPGASAQRAPSLSVHSPPSPSPTPANGVTTPTGAPSPYPTSVSRLRPASNSWSGASSRGSDAPQSCPVGLCCKPDVGVKSDQDDNHARVMSRRWPDGPVAMPWPRSGRTVRRPRRARRSEPRRQCRPGGRTSRLGPCAARASPRSP